jgi:hypothetical protein
MAQTKVRSKQQFEVTADVSFANFKLTNLATPVADTDAATKGYVDSIKQSLDIKDSCRVATVGTESFTIASGAVTAIGGTTIDGVSVVVNDRILIKNAPAATGTGSSPNTTQPANGLYFVTAVSTSISVSRTLDANVSSEVSAGLFTFVTEGTANSDNGYVLTTNDPITLNTTALTFSQFSGAGQITAGNGLTKTANTLSVLADSSATIAVSASGIGLAAVTPGATVAAQIRKFDIDSYGRISNVANANLTDIVTSIGSQTANLVFASPNGSAGNPSFRSLVANDIPSLDAAKITTGTLPATLGGTGFSSYAVGDILFASTTTALSKLADVATGNALISGGVGVAPSYGKIGLTTHISGTLAVGNGGTGLATAPTNGQLLIGNGTNYTLAALTGGTGISVTNGAGSISVAVNTSTVMIKTNFVTREVPTGTPNGVLTTFTLANTPTSGSEMLFVNGILMNVGATNDYTISTNTITFNAGAIPQTGDVLLVTYII